MSPGLLQYVVCLLHDLGIGIRNRYCPAGKIKARQVIQVVANIGDTSRRRRACAPGVP